MTNSASSASEKNLIKKYPLLVFFVLAYVFFMVVLMVIGGIVATFSVSPVAMGIFVSIASWAPNVAAFVVIWVNREPGGIRKLFAGWLRWRVHVGWYFFGLVPLVIDLAIVWGSRLMGNPSPGGGTGISGAVLLSMVIFNATQGATGEELGWRGFALPKLQARYSRFVSAIILGLLIAGWHSVLHLISPNGIPEWQFWLTLVCYSLVVAWIYNYSRSLLIVSLFHFAFNFGIDLVTTRLGLVSTADLFWGFVIIYLLLVLGVILLDGNKIWQKPV